jgi:hypothetical protein
MSTLPSMPPAPARHGRPPRASLVGTVNTTLRIPTDVHERLVKVADDRMVSRGIVVARALELYLPTLETDAL